MRRYTQLLTIAAFQLVSVCGFAFAADRHVVVINDTNTTLTELYASNIGTDDWQENILHRSTIEPGSRIRANIDDGSDYCHYDLKAVFANGESVVRRRLDVCVVETWTIHDN